jgi:hypothetical protein
MHIKLRFYKHSFGNPDPDNGKHDNGGAGCDNVHLAFMIRLRSIAKLMTNFIGHEYSRGVLLFHW